MSREHRSLEGFPLLTASDSGPNVPTVPTGPTGPTGPTVTSMLPHEVFAEPDALHEDDEPTGVLGTLKEMPVGEIVQTLQQGNKDALVEVKPKGAPLGVIGLVHGRVVYARTETLAGEVVEGEPAFQQLFCAHRGAFRIRYGRVPEAHNIDRDPVWLLLEAARVLDEHRAQNPVFETPAAGIPTLAPPVPAAPAGLPRTTTPFSRFFDEAGVKTPAPIPLPPDAQRFHSLQLAEAVDDVDDVDRVDTDRTTRERRGRAAAITPY